MVQTTMPTSVIWILMIVEALLHLNASSDVEIEMLPGYFLVKQSTGR